MNKIIAVIWLSVLILVSFNNNASAADVVISGTSKFNCSLAANFMEKHGYVFIEGSYNKREISTNMYAAKDAAVIIENDNGIVLGTGMVDKKGNFSITVPEADLYKVIVKFHGRRSIKHVQFSKIEDVMVYIGYFQSETVDNWLRTAALHD